MKIVNSSEIETCSHACSSIPEYQNDQSDVKKETRERKKMTRQPLFPSFSTWQFDHVGNHIEKPCHHNRSFSCWNNATFDYNFGLEKTHSAVVDYFVPSTFLQLKRKFFSYAKWMSFYKSSLYFHL